MSCFRRNGMNQSRVLRENSKSWDSLSRKGVTSKVIAQRWTYRTDKKVTSWCGSIKSLVRWDPINHGIEILWSIGTLWKQTFKERGPGNDQMTSMRQCNERWAVEKGCWRYEDV